MKAHKSKGLLTLILLLGCVCYRSVFALEIGPAVVFSSLNEPLAAEIPLTKLGDIKLETMGVSILAARRADADDISHYLLATTIKTPTGALLRISSVDPVEQSIVHFTLKLTWEGDHLKRKYALMLDPSKLNQPRRTPLGNPWQENKQVSAQKTPATIKKMTQAVVVSSVTNTAPIPLFLPLKQKVRSLNARLFPAGFYRTKKPQPTPPFAMIAPTSP